MNTGCQIAGQKLLTKFYMAIDEGRFYDAAACFHERGEWHRKGEVLTGPAEVAVAYDGRDASLRTRHVLSNMLLEENEQGMSFSLCITLFAGHAVEGEVPVVQGPSMVLTSEGLLVRDGGVWKIQNKRTDRQFIVKPSAT